MQLVSSQKSSHWYTVTGEAMHQIIGKTTGQPRNVTIKDARELKLIPSVTTILNLLAKPELDAWKQEQCIMSALTLPKLEGETDISFAKRVVQDSQEHAKNSAKFGTMVHDYISMLIQGHEVEFLEQFKEVPEALKQNTLTFYKSIPKAVKMLSETRLADEAIFSAGCIDLYILDEDGHGCLLDFKTQSFDDNKKPNYYDTWLYQLCAYKLLLESKGYPVHNIINVVVQANGNNQFITKLWKADEIESGTKVYLLLKNLFREIKKI